MTRFLERFGGKQSTAPGAGPKSREGRRKAPAAAAGLLSHRKAEHVKVVLGQNVEGRYRYWDDVQLFHNALPEIDFDEIDPSVEFFGQRLKAPLMITGMTGGYPGAVTINSNLAHAAADVGIAMGVGSERAAILKGNYPESYSCVAKFAVPLKFANIGAPQIIAQSPGDRVIGLPEARAAMELIGAQGLAIHLNFLQEMVQPEGDRRARGCLEQIHQLARDLPVLAKETGAGLSRFVGDRLKVAGVRAFDVSGTGRHEFCRGRAPPRGRPGGQSRSARRQDVLELGDPLARGRTRTGPARDANRRERRDPVGPRHGPGRGPRGDGGRDRRRCASRCSDRVQEARGELEQIIYELKVAMFLTGSRTVEELRRTRYTLIGETHEWLER